MSKVRSVKAIQVDANGRGALGLQDPTGELQTGTCDSSGNLNVNLAAGGAAATIADGADVTQGAIADAAVASDANGTISGKLRGLVKILADAWDSANHRLTVGLGAGTN